MLQHKASVCQGLLANVEDTVLYSAKGRAEGQHLRLWEQRICQSLHRGRENVGHAGIEYWGIQAVKVLLMFAWF